MEETTTSVGANLDRWRRHVGMSYRQLAEACIANGWEGTETSVATLLRRVVNGERQLRVEELLAVAVTLGVPPVVFLYGVPVGDVTVKEMAKWLHDPDRRVPNYETGEFEHYSKSGVLEGEVYYEQTRTEDQKARDRQIAEALRSGGQEAVYELMDKWAAEAQEEGNE